MKASIFAPLLALVGFAAASPVDPVHARQVGGLVPTGAATSAVPTGVAAPPNYPVPSTPGDVVSLILHVEVDINAHLGNINNTVANGKGGDKPTISAAVQVELKAIIELLGAVVALLGSVLSLNLKFTVEQVDVIAQCLVRILANISVVLVSVVVDLDLGDLLQQVLDIVAALLKVVLQLVGGLLGALNHLIAISPLVGTIEKLLGSVLSELLGALL